MGCNTINANGRIMIVDYETDICQGVCEIFLKKGFEIETLTSRQKDFQKAQKKQYNIALVDINQPDFEGINLLENLKQLNPNIDVIIVSRERDLNSNILAFNKGVSACFLKPLDINNLIDIMNNSIQKQRLIEEKRQAEQKLMESEGTLKAANENLERTVVRRTKELKESEQKYKLLSENLSDFVYILNDNLQFEYINESVFKEVMGYTSKDLVGRLNTETTHPDDIQKSIIELKRVFEARIGGECSYEVREKDRQGFYHWLEVRGKTFIDQDGRMKVLLIARDVTEKKKAQQKLREQERFLSNVFTSIQDGLFIVDKNFTIINTNPKIEEWFSAKQPIIGKTCYDLLLNRTAQCEDCNCGIMFGSQESYPERTIELIDNRKESRNLNILKLPLLDQETGYVKGLIIYLRDITSQKTAERLIKEELEKLRELDQIKNDLVQRISHELRTPLTAIYSGSEFLLNYCSDKVDNKTLKFLNIINTGGYRLKKLVDNLLLAFDIESDNLKLQLQNSDLIPIIEESIKNVAQMVSKRKILIHKNLHDNLCLTIDNSEIKKVIANLIFNAVQNTLKNGSIYISTRKDRNYIEIIIEDTGVGFTEWEKRMLFKKFGKIERYGKGMAINTEGVGLGLYIVKEIVELHGGRIWVESEGRNKGSIFTIRLFTNEKE